MQTIQYPALADISLTPVEVNDAALILSLRAPAVAKKYLNQGAANVSEQRDWIARYNNRPDKADDQYLMVIQDTKKVGAFRLRQLISPGASFSWGSWCMAPGLHPRVAIATCLLAYEVGFSGVQKTRVEFEVHTNNLSVISFHRRMGAKEVGRNHDQVLFTLDRSSYVQSREHWSASFGLSSPARIATVQSL